MNSLIKPWQHCFISLFFFLPSPLGRRYWAAPPPIDAWVCRRAGYSLLLNQDNLNDLFEFRPDLRNDPNISCGIHVSTTNFTQLQCFGSHPGGLVITEIFLDGNKVKSHNVKEYGKQVGFFF